jgi:hypothetical protein
MAWKAANHTKSKEKFKLKTLPNTLNASYPPLGRIYHVSPLNHPVSKEFYQLCAYFSAFDNELINLNLREAWDVMHEIKIRLLHKVYK